jgi:hypothetical protein
MTIDNKNEIPNGTIVFRIGKKWCVIPPNTEGIYLNENVFYIDSIPEGAFDVPPGKGSAQKSVQIIGQAKSTPDFEIKMGWQKARIFMNEGRLSLIFSGGKIAANKRWTIEKETGPHPKKIKHHRNKTITKIVEQVVANLSLGINSNNQQKETSTQNSLFPLPDESNKIVREKRILEQARWEYLRSSIYVRDKATCWVCNEFVLLKDYDLGHIVDRVNGGQDSEDNLAVMHKRCNNSKPRHFTKEEAMSWQFKQRTRDFHQNSIEQLELHQSQPYI